MTMGPVSYKYHPVLSALAVLVVAFFAVFPFYLMLTFSRTPQIDVPTLSARVTSQDVWLVNFDDDARRITAEQFDGGRVHVPYGETRAMDQLRALLRNQEIATTFRALAEPGDGITPIVIAFLIPIVLLSFAAAVDLILLITRANGRWQVVDICALMMIIVLWIVGPLVWFFTGRRSRAHELALQEAQQVRRSVLI